MTIKIPDETSIPAIAKSLQCIILNRICIHQQAHDASTLIRRSIKDVWLLANGSNLLIMTILIQKLKIALIDHELLIDPPPPRGNFVHYVFLRQRYIRNKTTHVGHLAVGA